ncbi:hypothetical protein AVEN_71556-1 [Araneus ventricosus]|uniref:Uncharacterized protein n=1 Tax=Araneus ventricosus TaxID=182803 RepID=A0A4Y2ESW0_ARAVE|nr:hypothetical protein AVEN_71556-1 [Araneus ventricosus]
MAKQRHLPQGRSRNQPVMQQCNQDIRYVLLEKVRKTRISSGLAVRSRILSPSDPNSKPDSTEDSLYLWSWYTLNPT